MRGGFHFIVRMQNCFTFMTALVFSVHRVYKPVTVPVKHLPARSVDRKRVDSMAAV